MLIIDNDTIPKNKNQARKVTPEILSKLITLKDAANKMGVSKSKIAFYIRNEDAPYYRVFGRIKVVYSEIVRYIVNKLNEDV